MRYQIGDAVFVLNAETRLPRFRGVVRAIRETTNGPLYQVPRGESLLSRTIFRPANLLRLVRPSEDAA